LDPRVRNAYKDSKKDDGISQFDIDKSAYIYYLHVLSLYDEYVSVKSKVIGRRTNQARFLAFYSSH